MPANSRSRDPSEVLPRWFRLTAWSLLAAQAPGVLLLVTGMAGGGGHEGFPAALMALLVLAAFTMFVTPVFFVIGCVVLFRASIRVVGPKDLTLLCLLGLQAMLVTVGVMIGFL